MSQLRVIWHRRDLRLTDNVLYDAANACIVPLYVFDPKEFVPTCSSSDANHQVARVGPFAARFLVESLQALRESLEGLGVDLFVRSGEPRNVVPAFLGELLQAGWHGDVEVVWHDEAGTYEASEAEAVRDALKKLSGQSHVNITSSSFWGCTMWHPLDLTNTLYRQTLRLHRGQEVDTSSEAWSQIKQQGVQSYRRKAKACPLRPPRPPPTSLSPLPDISVPAGDMPTVVDLIKPSEIFGLSKDEVGQIVAAALKQFDSRSAHPFCGGEAAGHQHLQTFVSGPAACCNREGGGDAGGGVDSSAKMSAYLAFGCLSPRTVHAVCKARSDCKAMWLPENMEMRDFWIFYALAHEADLFKRDGDGPANLPAKHWKPHNVSQWRRWMLGSTGFPLLDAAMKELLATGYTSNRCRQIPVSVLANDLALDWRSGAELYQWLLVDHDVGSNWGNWRYFAGVGCDPKRRHYKVLSQGLRYDAEACFVKTWLPQLRDLPAREAHLLPIYQARSLEGDSIKWPEPITDALKQLSWDDQKNLGGVPLASDYVSQPASAPFGGKGEGKGKGVGKRVSDSRYQLKGDSCQAESSQYSANRVRRWHAKAQA